MPPPGGQPPQAQLLSDFSNRHSLGEVLLVGQHQQSSLPQLLLPQDLLQLKSSLIHPCPIIRVHHIDDSQGVSIVIAPQPPDFVLAPWGRYEFVASAGWEADLCPIL
eukprot:TRINITY_DN11302_c0_g1_i1.p1 TRINITY_DN11302_c0_g1~~TRINITY_DN11302_c0_g1_i1.p1  ORF type:complete len:107 (+),score=13.81 TRINITY_DN11302_c0_g1_i1:61-381(+)